MIRLKECVIVEGKYDKQALQQIIDATIIPTNGFRIFRNREQRALIQTLAEQNGLVILTDSDRAGFLIRRHLKGLVPPEQVKNVYIPCIPGKEKRKAAFSKDGLLGVEGMDKDVLRTAFERAGILTITTSLKEKITKVDLYEAGLSGKEDSAALRCLLLKRLSLPPYLTANALLEILNATLNMDQFRALAAEIQAEHANHHKTNKEG